MAKKKSFINKKISATFCLVCRDSSSTFSNPFGILCDGDRVFTRVSDGTNYVLGFIGDDPHTNSEGEETESIFVDTDKDPDVEPNVKPKKDKYKGSHLNPYELNNGKGQGPMPDNIRKEIIELGFPNDGYNYRTPLKEISASEGGSAFAFVPCRKPKLESIPAYVKALMYWRKL